MAKSNVNPDHYKTAGRERQGEDIVQEIHRKKFQEAEAARRQPKKLIPSEQSRSGQSGKRKKARKSK